MPESEPECTETLLEVEAFLDGEVDPALATRIRGHLGDCSPCMDRAEFRKHLKELVQIQMHRARGARRACWTGSDS